MVELHLILLGFLVGFLVGLTGIGGGALTTPSFIFFGMEPMKAVGTSLLYVTATKSFGTAFHHRIGKIRYDIALRLLIGSIPAIILGGFLLRVIGKDVLDTYLTLLLGLILIFSGVLGLIKEEVSLQIKPRMLYLYLLGFIIGVAVQFTSVGAGVIVSLALMNLARISSNEVVGISIFYGLLLSLLSFLNYSLIGSVDYAIATILVPGSIIGVYAGTRISTRTKSERLKAIINVFITILGILTLASLFL